MLIGSEKWLTKEFRSSEDTFKRETDLKSAAQDIFWEVLYISEGHMFFMLMCKEDYCRGVLTLGSL